MRNTQVILDSRDRPLVVESEKVNLILLVCFFVFEAFVRVEDIFPVIESFRLVLVFGIGATLATREA